MNDRGAEHDQIDGGGDSDSGEALLRRLDSEMRRAPDDPMAALARVMDAQASPEPRPVRPTNIAGYRIGRLIGSGGMGELYEATNDHGERVAVKLVPFATADRRERFEAECSVLGRLDHPNIVRYRAHGGSPEGGGFLVMDLAPGITLEALIDDITRDEPETAAGKFIREGAPSNTGERGASAHIRNRIARIVLQVAEALAYAHARGIVHGDVKPANVMVDADLSCRLIDFGLSRDLFRDVSLTKSSHIMGTLAYLAPEQLTDRAGSMGAWTDVYALGGILRRLATGEERANTISACLREISVPFVLPRAIERALPLEWQAVLYRCLARHPRDRYPNAEALAADLRALLGTGRVAARRPHLFRRWWRRPRSRVAMIVAPLMAVLIPAAWVSSLTPSMVYLGATFGTGELSIDGHGPHPVPTELPISPGHHRYVYRSSPSQQVSTVQGEFDILAGRRFNRVTILANALNPDIAVAHDRQLWKLGPPAFLLIDPPKAAGAVVTLDGAVFDTAGRWADVAPGPHVISAQAPGGMIEVQEITLQEGALNYLQVLRGQAAKGRGAFRYTMATCLSPHPQFVQFRLDDGIVPRINGDLDKDRVVAGYLGVKCCIGLVTTSEHAEAVLHIDFPEPMRSISASWVAWANATYATITTEWSTDGIHWTSAKGTATTDLEAPSRWFELRAVMSASEKAENFSYAEFLGGYLDAKEKPTTDSPAFSIVADPLSGVAGR